MPGSLEDRSGALQRVRELRSRFGALRPSNPWGPGYKLWIGDIVEVVQDCWGSGSPQLTRIAGLLRSPNDAGDLAYLARLRDLDGLLDAFECELARD